MSGESKPPTDPFDTIEKAISDLPDLLVFEVTLAPSVPGDPFILYVAAESASQAAEKGEATAEAKKKGKFRVASLRRLGPLVR